MRVLTNNPLVLRDTFITSICHVEYSAGTLFQLMIKARDQVHLGFRLCTHPLSGSVKPNHTPYKSIGLSDRAEPALCMDSLKLIEDSIAMCGRLAVSSFVMNPKIDRDFQSIDLSLILSALAGQSDMQGM